MTSQTTLVNMPTSLPQATVLEAGCKVNLYLRIVGCREDGYHDLESLFVPLSNPCDRLHIQPGRTGEGLKLESSDPDLDFEHNTVRRSYVLFSQATGWSPPLRVFLEKNIPQGAGLGGGSSNAGSMLTYLQSQCPQEVRLSDTDLAALARQVGADVPFFLTNTPAWVQGIGDKVQEIGLAPSLTWLLLVCPRTHIATAEAYQIWDRHFASDGEQTCLTAMQKTDSNLSCCVFGRVLWNSFEGALFPEYPRMRDLKQRLLGAGARAAVLSGSGAAMVGLFTTREECTRAGQELKDKDTQTFINSIGTCWGVAKW